MEWCTHSGKPESIRKLEELLKAVPENNSQQLSVLKYCSSTFLSQERTLFLNYIVLVCWDVIALDLHCFILLFVALFSLETTVQSSPFKVMQDPRSHRVCIYLKNMHDWFWQYVKYPWQDFFGILKFIIFILSNALCFGMLVIALGIAILSYKLRTSCAS